MQKSEDELTRFVTLTTQSESLSQIGQYKTEDLNRGINKVYNYLNSAEGM